MNVMSVTKSNTLENYCKAQGIVKLALFDAKEDFRHMPDCEVGGIIEYPEDAKISLFTVAGNEIEIAEILGVKGIYLRTQKELEMSNRGNLADIAVVCYDSK